MIAVLDYGIGNLRSAEKALQHLGADAALVADPGGGRGRGRRGAARCRQLRPVHGGGASERSRPGGRRGGGVGAALHGHLCWHADALRGLGGVPGVAGLGVLPGPGAALARRREAAADAVEPAGAGPAGPSHGAGPGPGPVGLLRALLRPSGRAPAWWPPATTAGRWWRPWPGTGVGHPVPSGEIGPGGAGPAGNFVAAVAAADGEAPGVGIRRRAVRSAGRWTRRRRADGPAIPAIDLRGGRCVRLVEGDFDRETAYSDDPVAVAAPFRRPAPGGSTWSTWTGPGPASPPTGRWWRGSRPPSGRSASGSRPAAGCARVDDAEELLRRRRGPGRARHGGGGADPIWSPRSPAAGPERVAVGLDHRHGEVRVRGWTEGGGRRVAEIVPEAIEAGAAAVIVTDIARDGRLTGPDLAGLSALLAGTGAPIIASGGVRDLDDVRALARPGDAGGPGAGRGDRRHGHLRGPPRRRCRPGRVRGARPDMRAIRVIPCLDVDAGRVVKGVKFQNLRDAGDPVELAARYDEEGADELVFYDITASAEGRDTMVEVVARTAEQVFIPLTVGGGVRTLDDARSLLRVGADKVSVNSAAVAEPDLDRPAVRHLRGPVRGGRHRRSPLAVGLRGLHPRRPPRRPGSTRWPGPSNASAGAPARWCSTRWTATAPGTASTSS